MSNYVREYGTQWGKTEKCGASRYISSLTSIFSTRPNQRKDLQCNSIMQSITLGGADVDKFPEDVVRI